MEDELASEELEDFTEEELRTLEELDEREDE
jgi:hypothetical protein